MLTQTEQSLQVSTHKIWDRETPKANIGDYIRAPHTPVMRVIDKDIYPNGQAWLLVQPNSGCYTEEWIVEPEQEAQTEFEQGREHGRNDAAERLHPIYIEASCQYSTGYLAGYNSTQRPQQTKNPTPPSWSVVYDGEYWYKAWVGKSLVGKATTYQKAEQMAQKHIVSQKFWQGHRERVLAAYSD